MAEAKHTAGTWTVSDGHLLRVNAYTPGTPPVVVCGVHRLGKHTGHGDKREPYANARLIAAAPDLLESLEPFAKAAQVYREAFEGFHVTGDTAADRHASERERIARAEEAAFEYLANLGIDQFLAAETAVAKAKGDSS